MPNQRTTVRVELDDETLQCLAAVGDPTDVLERLAFSAADGLRHRHPHRDQTDVSLRAERAEADALAALERQAFENQGDALVQATRDRTDLIARAAREHADRQRTSDSPPTADADAAFENARMSVAHERFNEDADIERVRGERRRLRTDLVAAERDATDQDLIGERTTTDSLIGDLRDVNEKMVIETIRAQEMTDELRESEERYRTLFDLCPAGLYSCDASGVIQKFNRHATMLWGRAPEPGDTDQRFCGSLELFRSDGSLMPHEESPMAAVLDGSMPDVRDAEVVIERADGSRLTVIMNIHAIKNRRGEVTEVYNCFYDITERKQAEQQVANALSAERELSEFREMFIGILGHDLRSPLTSINMSAGMLQEHGRLDEQEAKLVERITRGGQRMADMISQLLDLTRGRLGGGFPLECTQTDLGTVIRGVVEEFDATIQVEADGDLTGLWDTGRIAEVVSNLVGNAVQYATRGTAVVVKARAQEAQVILEVSNQGEPIPDNVLPFIFEPFRRARQREKSASGNLGLGLYIAQQIVLSHGGTLDVRSADGTTTFEMRLPRRPPTE